VTGRHREIRVGAIVDSLRVPRWVATVVMRIDAEPGLGAHVFAGNVAAEAPALPASFRLYESLDARLFHTDADPLELVELALPLYPLDGRPGGGLSSTDVAMLTAAQLDVILDFVQIDGDTAAGAARYGVWSVEHADATASRCEAWLFAAMRERRVFRTSIVAERERRRIVLYESFGASDLVSLHRARAGACWKAAGALLNRLSRLASAGWNELEDLSRPSTGERPVPHRSPSALTVGRHTISVAAGVAGRRFRKLAFRDEWFLATRRAVDGRAAWSTPPDGFEPFENPPTHQFADPFPFVYGGAQYLFFESYSYRDGRAAIWFVPLDVLGRPAAEPRPALEREYHLSYPFLFGYGGEIFMIPESSDNRTIDLYRATRFPEDWRLEQTLFSDVRAVDSTIHETDGRFYLFANVAEEGASLDDELHLFSAARPTGPWQPHRANPVVADVRSARPAGRLFWADGHLIRPSQDCSDRYGGAVVLNRVEVLTKRNYRETIVGRLEPSWMPGLSGTHTLNVLNGLDAIDGRRLRARPALRLLRRS
jgi:hypothetical protein